MSENERLYSAIADLGRFIEYMARSECVSGGHWFLDKEDLKSEAHILLLDLVDRYESKEYSEFLKLCRRSIANKFKSFKGKYLKSNRKNDHYAISFEDVSRHGSLYSDIIGFTLDVTDSISDNHYMSSLNPSTGLSQFPELYESLMEFDRSILDCLLGRNGRVAMYLHLVICRSRFMKSENHIRINEYIIARALCCHKMDVREGFDRIKHAIERNVNG